VRSLRDSTRGLKLTKIKTNTAVRGLFRKTLFPQFSKLLALSVIFDLEKIHPSGNFKGKYPFKPEWVCWNTNTNCDKLMLRSIAPAINLKTAGKYYSSGFLRSFSLASLISGYLWYSSFTANMLLTTTAKEKTLFAENLSLFAWSCRLYWSADHLNACAKCNLVKSRF